MVPVRAPRPLEPPRRPHPVHLHLAPEQRDVALLPPVRRPVRPPGPALPPPAPGRPELGPLRLDRDGVEVRAEPPPVRVHRLGAPARRRARRGRDVEAVAAPRHPGQGRARVLALLRPLVERLAPAGEGGGGDRGPRRARARGLRERAPGRRGPVRGPLPELPPLPDPGLGLLREVEGEEAPLPVLGARDVLAGGGGRGGAVAVSWWRRRKSGYFPPLGFAGGRGAGGGARGSHPEEALGLQHRRGRRGSGGAVPSPPRARGADRTAPGAGTSASTFPPFCGRGFFLHNSVLITGLLVSVPPRSAKPEGSVWVRLRPPPVLALSGDRRVARTNCRGRSAPARRAGAPPRGPPARDLGAAAPAPGRPRPLDHPAPGLARGARPPP